MMTTPQKTSGAMNGIIPSLVRFAVLSLLPAVGDFADASLPAAESGVHSVTAFGAKTHGTNDNTQAIQKALDEAQICVKVDQIQPMGLLISNGQFVCMHGDIRTEVLVEKTCHGSVRLVNCAFWGPARQCVVSHSRSSVSLSDCFLSSTGRKSNPGNFLVEADSGRLQVRGCSFGSDEPGIALRMGLQHAIITENNGVSGVEIANRIGERAVLANNEPLPLLPK